MNGATKQRETRMANEFQRLADRIYRERLAAGEVAAPRVVEPSPAARVAITAHREARAKRQPIYAARLASAQHELAAWDAARIAP